MKFIARMSQMARQLVALAKDTDLDLNDVHAYGGLAMVWFGLHEIYPAAAWVGCGLVLFWLGVREYGHTDAPQKTKH